MTSMLVIDVTTRDLFAYTANVTRATSGGLVIRQALDLSSLPDLTNDREGEFLIEADLPVLLVGNGYQAGGSSGFVSLGRMPAGAQMCAIVGMLGFGRPLRTIWPRCAHLLGRAQIFEHRTAGNSNGGTAQAAKAGIKLLELTNPSGLIVAEGQADSVSVWQFLPPEGQKHFNSGVTIDSEHQNSWFTLEALVRNRIQSAAHFAKDRHGWDGHGTPPQITELMGRIAAGKQGWALLATPAELKAILRVIAEELEFELPKRLAETETVPV